MPCSVLLAMPITIIVTVLTSLISSVLALVLKDYYDDCTGATPHRHHHSFPAASDHETDAIAIDGVMESLSDTLDFVETHLGGVCVIAAPPGAGKTTHLLKCLRRRNTARVVYLTALNWACLERAFGNVRGRSFADLIPRGTLLVIDQLDDASTVLSAEEEKDLLVQLATESCNWGTFVVVVCVSKADVASTVLSLNGAEKFQLIMDPFQFQWSANKMATYLEGQLPDWDQQELAALVAKCTPSKCAAVVRLAVWKITLHGWASILDNEQLNECIDKWCSRRLAQWSEFGELTRNFPPF